MYILQLVIMRLLVIVQKQDPKWVILAFGKVPLCCNISSLSEPIFDLFFDLNSA